MVDGVGQIASEVHLQSVLGAQAQSESRVGDSLVQGNLCQGCSLEQILCQGDIFSNG